MTTFWTCVIDHNIATLSLDICDEKVNKLTRPVLEELSRQLHLLKQSPLLALVIRSKKKDMFIAGADIRDIQDISDEEDAYQKAVFGQDIFSTLANLSFPSIAVLHGATLGGGCELALACTYRIATESPKTSIGLPEVNLGILPGFGGTQRLPKLIGLSRSLDLILTGKPVSGKKALQIGLVDACVPEAFLEEKIVYFLDVLAQGKKIPTSHRKPKGLLHWLLDQTWVGLQLSYILAKRRIRVQTKNHYPAPLLALRAICKGYRRSLKTGLKQEAILFSQLATSQTCKNLIALFFGQEMLKKEGLQDSPPLPIRSACIVGAGFMGGGIAWALASAEIPVRMKDIRWDAIAHGYRAASDILKTAILKKKLLPHVASLIQNRLSGGLTYIGFEKTDIVIEAVLEDIDLKKKVLADIEEHVCASTILASNTSALSITTLASALRHPERVIGMHFFSPVHRMPLVEVVVGKQTSPATISAVVNLAKRLKKIPIVVQDCPGFLVNRVLIPYVNEAIRLNEEGMPIEQIDQLMEAFGMPIGPLALADEVGLDVGYKVASILQLHFPDRVQLAKGFEWMHHQHDLKGKKTKQGFYTYHSTHKKPNQLVADAIRVAGPTPGVADAVDRMVLIMVNEIARCVDEAIVSDAMHADMAMILGSGFPPFRGGLCRYADQRGIVKIVNRLDELASLYGSRFDVAPSLRKMSQENKSFYTSFEEKKS